MTREHLETCAFCSGKKFKDLSRQTDYVHRTTDEKFLYVQCTACGLVFLQDRPAESEMARYYPDNYSFYRTGLLEPLKDAAKRLLYRTYHDEFNPFWALRPVLFPFYWLAQKSGATNAIREYRQHPYLPAPPARLLDVGCGSGTTFHPFGRRFSLQWLAQHGYDCAGVEVDARACEIAKKHGLRVTQGSFDRVALESREYDAVRMNHSLEHVHDPAAYIKRAWQALKPGGALIISVPNFEGFTHKTFPDAFEAPRHLFYFSARSLTAFLENNGFKIMSAATDPTPEIFAFVQERLSPEKPAADVLKLLPEFRALAQTGLGDDLNIVAAKVSK